MKYLRKITGHILSVYKNSPIKFFVDYQKRQKNIRVNNFEMNINIGAFFRIMVCFFIEFNFSFYPTSGETFQQGQILDHSQIL